MAYTEVDPNGHLAINTTNPLETVFDFTGLTRGEKAYFWEAGTFNDFVATGSFNITSSNTSALVALAHYGDILTDYKTLTDTNKYLAITYFQDSGDVTRVQVSTDVVPTPANPYAITLGTTYYWEQTRVGADITLKLYTGSIGGTLVSTQLSFVLSSDTYNYKYRASSFDTTAPLFVATGTVSEFNSEAITVTSDDFDEKFYQRDITSDAGSYSLSGTYLGTPTALQYRLVEEGTTTPITGHDWTTFDSSPSGEVYSYEITGIPVGAVFITPQVRDSTNIAIIGVSATSFAMGIRVLHAGQSDEDGLFSRENTITPLSSFIRLYEAGVGVGVITGNGAITLGNALFTQFGCAVELINSAVSSTGLLEIVTVDVGNNWLNADQLLYDAAIAAVNYSNDIEFISWGQGENDALDSLVNQTNYLAGLETLRGKFQTDIRSDIKMIVSRVGRRPGQGDDPEIWDSVRRAQEQFIQAHSDVYGLSTYDFELRIDGTFVHYDDAGFINKGKRIDRANKFSLGLVTDYEGPRIDTITIDTLTTTIVTLTLDGGTALTPTSSISGWEVKIGSSWFTSSGAVSGLELTLTHTSGVVTDVRNAYGTEPDITTVLTDNTALNLPVIAGSITVSSNITVENMIVNTLFTGPVITNSQPTETTVEDLIVNTYFTGPSISNNLIAGLISINITVET